MLSLLLGIALQVQVGNATVFGTVGDKWAGGPAACATRDHATGKWVNRTIAWHRRHGTLGIAHRSLPCRTRVRITDPKTGRSVVAIVIDRGPFGACTKPGWKPRHRRCQPRKKFWRVKKHRKDGPGVWRSVADLLPATGKALGYTTGLHRVRLEVLK